MGLSIEEATHQTWPKIKMIIKIKNVKLILAGLNFAINMNLYWNIPSPERKTHRTNGVSVFGLQSLDPSWLTAWPLPMASSTAPPLPLLRNRRWSFWELVVLAWFPISCASFNPPTLPAPSASSHCLSLPNEIPITGPSLSPSPSLLPFQEKGFKISICRCNTSLLIDYCGDANDRKYILIDVGKTFRETVLRWFVSHRIPRVDSVSAFFHDAFLI